MRLRPPAAEPTARSGRSRRVAAVLAGSLVLGLAAATGTAAAAPAVQRISDAQLVNCPAAVCQAESDGGTAAVVDDGPDSFLRLTTPGSSAKAAVRSYELYGQRLSALDTLTYDTYIETVGSGNDQQAPSINIEINPGEQGETYATLVWEPIYTGQRVTPGQWQTWTPSSSQGGWWSTRADPLTTGQPNKWGFPTYTATFAEVKAALRDATILSVGVNQGSGSTALVARADRLTVDDTVYDFDNPVRPTKLVAVSGAPQSAVALSPFAQPLKARLTGRDGTVPAPGETVTYTVTSGSAAFPGGTGSATATTDADGVATSPTLTAGLVPGPVTVTATGGGQTATFALTVNPPSGPPVADLALTVTGVPATAAPGSSFTATVTVRNTSSFPATRVATALNVPTGLRVASAPGGIATPAAAAFIAPTLAPGGVLTYPVRITVDAGARGARTINAAVNSTVRDPDLLDNTARPTVTVR